MSAHDHTTRVPGCFRCEMSGDELGMSATGPTTPGETGLRCALDGCEVDAIPCGGRCHLGCRAQVADAERGGESGEAGALPCCNEIEPDGILCGGTMSRRWPVYICDTCHAQCGVHAHPNCRPAPLAEPDIAPAPALPVGGDSDE